MGKTVIEEDYRNIEWVEDCEYPKPNIPDAVRDAYFEAMKRYGLRAAGEDHDHWFTIIDGDTVEIIPASQYKVEE